MKYALISVFDKDKICGLSRFLLGRGYKIISTGGTYKTLINELSDSTNILSIEQITGFPEILGGRVKTLQPLIQAGILADRENVYHLNEMKMFNIPDIDLVVTNLYPFSEVISRKHDYATAIENIDIGGVTLIRAAAKNHKCVTVFTDPSDYELIENITDDVRKFLSKKAFEYVCLYDMKISEYFSGNENVYRGYKTEAILKYGANPHQEARVMSQIYPQEDFPFETLNGNAGYINYMDAARAWDLVCEASCMMNNIEVAASFKHTTPAGVAIDGPVDDVILDHLGMHDIKSGTARAVARARDCDPLSSFGDLIAVSHKVDLETALVLKREFSDGIIAPDYDEYALRILSSKKSNKYLILKATKKPFSKGTEIHEISSGVALKQDRNYHLFIQRDFQNIVTNNKNIPSFSVNDLLLANITLKYTPSNSIAISFDGRVIGVGAGQQNRVDCVRLAGKKAMCWILRRNPKTKSLKFDSDTKRQDKINARILFSQGHSRDSTEQITDEERQETLRKSEFCLASDAFFPFKDSIDVAQEYGVKHIVQPGGSVADKSVIDTCNKYDMSMITTGKRVFLH